MGDEYLVYGGRDVQGAVREATDREKRRARAMCSAKHFNRRTRGYKRHPASEKQSSTIRQVHGVDMQLCGYCPRQHGSVFPGHVTPRMRDAMARQAELGMPQMVELRQIFVSLVMQHKRIHTLSHMYVLTHE